MHAAHQVTIFSIMTMLGALVSPQNLHGRLAEEELKLMGVSAQRRMEALSDMYLEYIDVDNLSGRCENVKVEDVEEMFDATALVAVYRKNNEWVGRAECLHSALDRNRLSVDRHNRLLHGLLVSVHRFHDANLLRKRYSIDVPILPDLPKSEGPGLQVIKMKGESEFQVLLLPVTASTQDQIIAIVHPYCGFSKRALDAILNDPRHAWLRPRLQLVVARESIWPEPAIRSWNMKHPDHPMHMQAMGSDWEHLETLETPIFHLLRNGESVISTKGWSGDGKEVELLRRKLDRSEL